MDCIAEPDYAQYEGCLFHQGDAVVRLPPYLHQILCDYSGYSELLAAISEWKSRAAIDGGALSSWRPSDAMTRGGIGSL